MTKTTPPNILLPLSPGTINDPTNIIFIFPPNPFRNALNTSPLAIMLIIRFFDKHLLEEINIIKILLLLLIAVTRHLIILKIT
jgi:hypothetical protein